mmetsp:Transcript_96688/g.243735  ORF Transcript_96688/g.243735 Transcript_96688/m.243735 type:complete len:244 (+) Transcript_96688:890-1621(+)
MFGTKASVRRSGLKDVSSDVRTCATSNATSIGTVGIGGRPGSKCKCCGGGPAGPGPAPGASARGRGGPWPGRAVDTGTPGAANCGGHPWGWRPPLPTPGSPIEAGRMQGPGSRQGGAPGPPCGRAMVPGGAPAGTKHTAPGSGANVPGGGPAGIAGARVPGSGNAMSGTPGRGGGPGGGPGQPWSTTGGLAGSCATPDGTGQVVPGGAGGPQAPGGAGQGGPSGWPMCGADAVPCGGPATLIA